MTSHSSTASLVADKPDLEQREPAEETYAFPLSAQQRGLWFIQQLDPASATLNTPLALRLWGDLDVSALARALSEIHRRHEILRTTYLLTDEDPVQKVHPPRPVRLSQVDLSGLPVRVRSGVAFRLRRAECERPVDLENGPIMRVTLLRLGEREYELLLITHHIANDGWSESILLRELTVLYETYRQGRPSPLPDLPIQYADYALWQREHLSDDLIAAQLEYWRRKLGTLSALELPRDYVAPAQTRWRGEMLRFKLPVELSLELRNLAQREGVTLFVVLLAGFKLLLRRYSGQEDIAVGTIIANRNQREIQDLIGCFINNLVLRTDLSGPLTFRELVKRVGATTLEAYEHQDVPFDRLVEELNPERYGGMPLVQALMVFQNTPSAELRLEGLQFEQLPMEFGYSYEHLSLSMHEESKALAGYLIYSTELFARASMERMLGYFERLLSEVTAAPDRDVDKIPLLSPEEREQVLYRWNATDADYSAAGSRGMHQLFEQQAELSPEAVALTHKGRSLTYGRLNAKANQLAHYLRELGVGPDARVAICVERGIEMVVALLAVLKAEGAYIPLDPAYPHDRLAYLLEDSAPSVLLTDDAAQRALVGPLPAIPVLNLDGDATRWADRPECNPEPSAAATAGRHLAYVIYTSGSTGAPKGVGIEHASAFNFICWAKSAFDPGLLQRTLFSTSLNFDLAVFECFVPLSVGAGVVIVDNALDPGLPSLDATLINTVPSVMKTLVEAGGVPGSVRLVNLAGEPLRRELVERIFTTTQAEAVCNLYGPSETTTYSTWVRMGRGEAFAPHIGAPISNTQVYILNEKLEPSPVGVVGEIYIAGAGVARGYLNRPGLTAERFLPAPFGERIGQRMYKTGDLGRWLPGGKIEFLGRNDFQVKVRGFRIELGEIEAALSAHPAVREAVVVAREEGEGDKRLVAYYTGEGEASEALRLHLSAALPNYMVPSAYVCLESLPLTPNGKLDRKALPAPDADAYASRDYQPPRGEAETMLAAIWADALKLERVGRHDNFFDLGGHSLLAVKLKAMVRQRLGFELPQSIFFTQPTIAGLAAALDLSDLRRDGPLVLLRLTGERAPLFLVHAAGGGLFPYRELTNALPPRRPIYGLERPGLESGEVAELDVEQLAAHYLEPVMRRQPHGPYAIAGWSFGGLVAFEMARQLRSAGERVAFLGLIDAQPPLGRVRSRMHRLALKMGLTADGLFDREAQTLGVALDEAAGKRLQAMLDAHVGAMLRYSPGGEIDAERVVLFRAAASKAGFRTSRSGTGWQSLSRRPIEQHTIAGDHYSIMKFPQAASLAEALAHAMGDL